MQKIPLRGKRGQGQFAIVDDDDFPILSQYAWHLTHGYPESQIHRKHFKMHSLLIHVPMGYEPDHVNLNRLDNRKANLRLATHGQNGANRKKRVRKDGTQSSSSYKGVSWHKAARLWCAKISSGQHGAQLGYFHSEIEAARAYDQAAMLRWGQFSQLNFPQ